jgi:hypothetical protein
MKQCYIVAETVGIGYLRETGVSKIGELMRFALALFMTVLAAPHVADGQGGDVRSVTRSFIDAYARGDSDTVLQSIDERTTVYGSDANQVVHGTAEVKVMLAKDAHLWAGKARIGQMRDISTSNEGDLQTIFFNATFSVGNRPPAPVRFCMVWRRSGTVWHLVQGSTAVVTQGQSSKAILKENAR